MKNIFKILSLSLLLLPVMVSAQTFTSPNEQNNNDTWQTVSQQSYNNSQKTVSGTQSLSKINNANDLVVRIASIGNVVIYLLVSLAVVYIVWNTVIYFIKPAADRAEGGMNILYGIIGLFVIVSLWGLVNILVNTFGTNPNVPADKFPNVNFITTK